MAELKPCPVCGSKAYLSHDIVDGFDFGYSVGCPRYCLDDGIHGISSYEDHIKRGYGMHGFYTMTAAIRAWNRRVDNE